MEAFFEAAKQVIIEYSEFSNLEYLVSGICIGITSLSPKIIFKFLSQSKRLGIEQKTLFLRALSQGLLGNAKKILEQAVYIGRAITESYQVGEPPENPCSLCRLNINFHNNECALLESCGDLYHEECLKKYLEKNIKEKVYPIKCHECPKELIAKDIRSRVSESSVRDYDQLEINSADQKFEIEFICPVQSCGNKVLIKKPGMKKIVCNVCSKTICVNCRVIYHEGSSCEIYQTWKRTAEKPKVFLSR